jgi:DNA-binding transcriptional LysR family regulator
MWGMNLANKALPDLNLVRVFLAVWETRSLTAAGQRLSLTQPAVSHALRRLRDAFEDPLFVRTAAGMKPTEMATRLHRPLGEALQIIQRAVQDSERFDPATAQRLFRVAMSDVSEFFFLPRLMVWLAATAPGVHLEIVPLNQATVIQAMRAGEVDLTIGYVPELDDEYGDEVTSCHLFTDSFVCLVRAGHPAIGAGGDVDLGALGYIYASTTAAGHQLAERWLGETGPRRRIVLRLGHFTIAPSIVRRTDLAVIFPQTIAQLMNEDGSFVLLPLPAGRPVVDIRVYTHQHFRGDAGTRWLQEGLVALFAHGRDRPGAEEGQPHA